MKKVLYFFMGGLLITAIFELCLSLLKIGIEIAVFILLAAVVVAVVFLFNNVLRKVNKFIKSK